MHLLIPRPPKRGVSWSELFPNSETGWVFHVISFHFGSTGPLAPTFYQGPGISIQKTMPTLHQVSATDDDLIYSCLDYNLFLDVNVSMDPELDIDAFPSDSDGFQEMDISMALIGDPTSLSLENKSQSSGLPVCDVGILPENQSANRLPEGLLCEGSQAHHVKQISPRLVFVHQECLHPHINELNWFILAYEPTVSTSVIIQAVPANSNTWVLYSDISDPSINIHSLSTAPLQRVEKDLIERIIFKCICERPIRGSNSSVSWWKVLAAVSVAEISSWPREGYYWHHIPYSLGAIITYQSRDMELQDKIIWWVPLWGRVANIDPSLT